MGTAPKPPRGADAPPLAVKIGDVVLERYRIVEQIASGGHSVVFRGQDERLSRPVCIKVFSGMGGNSGVGRTSYEHFVQEAFALSRLTHPNTLRIYDFGHLGPKDAEGMPLQVCEYMNGGTLSQIVREQGRQTLAETVRIVNAMCLALGEAHALGIVHRDIKPQNILFGAVGASKLPKLADFGIAKWSADDDNKQQRAEDTAIVAGQKLAMYSPSWAAPEQLAGQPVSAATDIYSLACVAVYMLSGKAIFAEDDVYAGYRKRRHGGDLAAAALQPLDLPPAVIELLAKALAFDPKQRLAGVEELAQQLTTALEAADAPRPVAVEASAPQPSASGPQPASANAYPAGSPPSGGGGYPVGSRSAPGSGYPAGSPPSAGGYPVGSQPPPGSAYPVGSPPSAGGYPVGSQPPPGSAYPVGSPPSAGGYPVGSQPPPGSAYPVGSPSSAGGYPVGSQPPPGSAYPVGSPPSVVGGYPVGSQPPPGSAYPVGSPSSAGGYPVGSQPPPGSAYPVGSPPSAGGYPVGSPLSAGGYPVGSQPPPGGAYPVGSPLSAGGYPIGSQPPPGSAYPVASPPSVVGGYPVGSQPPPGSAYPVAPSSASAGPQQSAPPASREPTPPPHALPVAAWPPALAQPWMTRAPVPQGPPHRLAMTDLPQIVGDRRVHYLHAPNHVADLIGGPNSKVRVTFMTGPTGTRVLHLKGLTCFVAQLGGRPSPAVQIEHGADIALVTPRAQDIGHIRVSSGTASAGQTVFPLGSELVSVPADDCIDAILFDFGPGSEAYFVYTRGRPIPKSRRG